MAISDSEVIAELTSYGPNVKDHFLIGSEICLVNRHREVMTMVIEDMEGEEEMYFAILGFLRRIGVKEYRSHEEYDKQRSKS